MLVLTSICATVLVPWIDMTESRVRVIPECIHNHPPLTTPFFSPYIARDPKPGFARMMLNRTRSQMSGIRDGCHREHGHPLDDRKWCVLHSRTVVRFVVDCFPTTPKYTLALVLNRLVYLWECSRTVAAMMTIGMLSIHSIIFGFGVASAVVIRGACP